MYFFGPRALETYCSVLTEPDYELLILGSFYTPTRPLVIILIHVTKKNALTPEYFSAIALSSKSIMLAVGVISLRAERLYLARATIPVRRLPTYTSRHR